MHVTIRPARPDDMTEMIALLIEEARTRHGHNPDLWKLPQDAADRVGAALKPALAGESRLRQVWLVAEAAEQICGLSHSVVFPAPPIYLAPSGPPGFLAGDCCVRADGPAGAMEALLEAAEQDLIEAGIKMLVGQAQPDTDRHSAYISAGYQPVTLYYAKSGFTRSEVSGARQASVDDVPAIVRHSAVHRKTLERLSRFWIRHPQADSRFDAWMRKSLGLADRDMLISAGRTGVDGYAIAQPATELHFPPAHDIRAVGHLDDFFHVDFAKVEGSADQDGAMDLIRAAESAFAARGITSTLVVCPYGWTSKRRLLDAAGYDVALVWLVKWV